MQEIFTIPRLPRRVVDSHKGDFGKILILAGSQGMTGAAWLTTFAALRSGAGLVTLGLPQSLLPIVATLLPCAMTHPFAETKAQSLSLSALAEILSVADSCDVVALGPGLGRYPDTQALVLKLVAALAKPLVLDADALFPLTNRLDLLQERKFPTILTPHPGEFSRLTGLSIAEIRKDRAKVAHDFARAYPVTLVLKGAGTIVTEATQVYTNKTGNPGMAKGGSGDVLTGMIAALLGQKLSSWDASVLSVYLHGLAGDLARNEMGETAMIASDIISKLPAAFEQNS